MKGYYDGDKNLLTTESAIRNQISQIYQDAQRRGNNKGNRQYRQMVFTDIDSASACGDDFEKTDLNDLLKLCMEYQDMGISLTFMVNGQELVEKSIGRGQKTILQIMDKVEETNRDNGFCMITESDDGELEIMSCDREDIEKQLDELRRQHE